MPHPVCTSYKLSVSSIDLCVSNLFLAASARMLCIFLERHSKLINVTLYTNNSTMKNQHAGLLFKSRGPGIFLGNCECGPWLLS